MIRVFIFSALLLLSACSPLLPHSGQVLRGDIYWQGEVRLHGDIRLDKDAILTIAPGTRVVFEAPREGEDLYQEHPYFIGSELIIHGRLRALGTRERPIVFTADQTDALPGHWGGLNIEESPESQFQYVIFEQANSAIHSRQSWVTIDHAIFRNNLVGVRFHDTELLVENSLFENNDTAIRFHFGSPVICNNLIRNNRKGMFISSEPRDYRIENNAFIDNQPYQVNLGEGVRDDVDLRNNYWSDDSGTPLEERFFDGRADDWLGRINYLPRREDKIELDFLQ